MANHATKQGNEALRPMGSNTVPVLFSLKNVQPLILNAPPASPTKEKAPTADQEKASVASHSGFVAASANLQAPADTAALSRPTKVTRGSPILRTVGTVLLVLLVILVIRMSVPGGSQNSKLATQKSSDDASGDSQKLPELATKPTSLIAATPVSQVVVPALPLLAESTVNLEQKADSILLAPISGAEDVKAQAQVSLQLGSVSTERPASTEQEALPNLELSGGSPVPTLLAAVPSGSSATATPGSPNPGFPSRLQSESPAASSLTLGESAPSGLMNQPRSDTSPATMSPYTATRPELHSTNDIRETSTPNLDSMEDLITLYRKGLVDGPSAPTAPVASGSTSARQVSTGSSPQQSQSGSIATQSSAPFIPTTPYAPLSSATNWPTTSIAIPSSQVGGVARSEAVSPSVPVNNNTLPMSGQSYPPPQRSYEPLTLPTQDSSSNASGLSQNGMNRYQATIRQPNDGSSAPITQPKLPYTPVGPSATSPTATAPASTGTTGSSFGYPPINVPSN
jgi:hypothetical protein